MSTVQPSDLPDFDRAGQFLNAVPIVNMINLMFGPGGTNFGRFYLPTWDHLEIFLSSQGNFGGSASWFLDAACTELAGLHNFSAPANGIITVNLPILAPWVILACDFTDGAVPVQGSALITPRIGQDRWARTVNDGAVLKVLNQNIAAGGNTAFRSQYATVGPATLAINTAASAWRAAYYAVDLTGAFAYPLAVMVKNAAQWPTNAQVMLPPHATELLIFNDDAGLQSFSAAVQLALL